MDVSTARPPAAAEGREPAPAAAGLDGPVHATRGEGRRPSAMRRWVRRFVSLTATLAVVGLATLAVALTAVPAVVGGHALTVLSGSMVPEFAPGAMVVDTPAKASSLRVGDVITYATIDAVSGTPILITHRIVEVRSASGAPTFITRGDANDSADDRPVEASQVRGKVWYAVPYIGTARNFLLAKGAGLIIGGAVGLIAAVWFLLRLAREPETVQDVPVRKGGPTRRGRHRARNSTVATALLGVLLILGHPVTHRQTTYAHFSDEETLQIQITTGGAPPSP
jgi:signal peptidase I